jgi:hypothetical protein
MREGEMVEREGERLSESKERLRTEFKLFGERLLGAGRD